MSEDRNLRGFISVTIVPVRDMDRALTFYRDTLGLTVRFSTPEWTELETEKVILALQLARVEREPQREDEARLTFDVENIEGESAWLRGSGVRFTVDPHDEPYGRMAVFHDSEGNGIELVQRKVE